MAGALLSLLGVFVATYLFLFKLGKIGTLACGTGSCETVQLSPYSSFFGIDVALIGIVGYSTLFLLSLVLLRTAPGTRTTAGRVLLVLSAVGMLFTVYLTYLELFVIHAICRWCVGSGVLITGVFAVAVLDWRRGVATAPLRTT
jgi:uncharacterized membrane protein